MQIITHARFFAEKSIWVCQSAVMTANFSFRDFIMSAESLLKEIADHL